MPGSAGAKSDLFDITNGTRQGSVASPVLWAVYCDPLIQEGSGSGGSCWGPVHGGDYLRR